MAFLIAFILVLIACVILGMLAWIYTLPAWVWVTIGIFLGVVLVIIIVNMVKAYLHERKHRKDPY